MKYFTTVYLVVVLTMSVVTFVAYGFDKFRAKRNGRRVPENTLHILAFLGGWPGALLGQKFFRHKTQKTSFRIVFWISVVCSLLLFAGGLYLTRAL